MVPLEDVGMAAPYRKDGKKKKIPKSGEIAMTTGEPRKGSGSKRNPNVNMTNWREQLQARRVKFDDDQKQTYLKHLELTGLKGHSAKVANTTPQTVIKHLKNDPDFCEQCDVAIQRYNDGIAAEVVRRGRDGVPKPVWKAGVRALDPMLNEDGTVKFDEDGNPILVPAHVLEYSDRLLELEAKRGNPDFRDGATIGINSAGGVIVLSGRLSVEEAEAADAVANAEAIAKRQAEGGDK